MKRKELFIVATIALLLVGCSPKATTESYCLMNNTDETLAISSISKSKDVFPGEGYVITDITHSKDKTSAICLRSMKKRGTHYS